MSELNPHPACTCAHPLDCVCGCHGRHCDPNDNVCDLAYLPDDGGLTQWGCADCTPGELAPHVDGCPAVVFAAAAPGAFAAPMS
jgi:hypothetical protein